MRPPWGAPVNGRLRAPQKEKAPAFPPGPLGPYAPNPSLAARAGGVADLGADLVERAREAAAHGAQGADEHHRDEGGDEAVLDGGRTGFVLQEARQELGHWSFLSFERRVL